MIVPSWSSLRRSWSIARLEYRRTVRRLCGRPGTLAVLLVFVVPTSVVLPLGLVVFGGHAAGVAVRTDPATLEVATVRPLAAITWLYLVTMSTITGLSTYGRLERPAIELLAASTRTVVLGKVLSGLLAVAAVGAVPLALAIGSYAVGARDPVTAGSITLAAAILFAFGFAVGYTLGVAVGALVARLESDRLGLLAVAVFFGGYTAIVLTGSQMALDPLVTLVARTPVGWAADLAVAPRESVQPTRAVGVLVLTGGAVIASSRTLPTLARARWIDG